MKFLFIAVLLMSTNAFAIDGGSVSNGGDMCENRFSVVREDIFSWIKKGGSEELVLPSKISHSLYKKQMISKIEMAKVSCIDDKIFVGNAEKTCKNYESADGQVFIVCNTLRFMNTPESDQYVLVHHEYAGLSGFEVNQTEESNYKISNQITGFLENQVVKKLAVKPARPPAMDDPFAIQNSCNSGELMNREKAIQFLGAGNSAREIGTSKIYKRTRKCNAVTGCGEWSSPSFYDYLQASMLVAQRDVVISFKNSSIVPLQLGWGEPYGDGSVNGCRWNKGFEDKDSFCNLYLRSGCLRFVSTEALNEEFGEVQYSAYWTIPN